MVNMLQPHSRSHNSLFLQSANHTQTTQDITSLQQTQGNRVVARHMESMLAGGGDATIMRQRQTSASSFRQQVFVVRDPSIDLGGGRLVNDLAAFKTQVMQLRNSGAWTLVLAIHGSENRIAAQAPPNWQANAVFYEAGDINQLFSNDAQWVAWRDQFGPNHVALVSCQVSVGLERVLIQNLTRHTNGTGSQQARPSQSAQGLGQGCTPISVGRLFDLPNRRPLRNRRQFRRQSPEEQERILQQLREWNRTFGYYGAPPVPENQILNYFFDEVPHAEWVNVHVGRNDTVLSPPIPFWNRSTGPESARFRRLCSQGMGNLSPRRSRAPQMRESAP